MKKCGTTNEKRKRLNILTVFPMALSWPIAGIIYNSTFEKKNIVKLHPVKPSVEWKNYVEKSRRWLLDNIERTDEITAYDGVKLKAYIVKCSEPERVVLAFEGWRAITPSVLSPLNESLAKQNSLMVLPANRGCGESGGNLIGMGMLEKYDVRSWVNYCREHYPDLPLYVEGISMGCSSVLLGAEESWNDKVSGIIADCGFVTPYDQVKFIIRNNANISGHFIMEALNRIVRARMNEDMRANNTIQTLACCSVPILFIHGAMDDFVPPECSKENYESYKGPKKLLLIEGAGHAKSFMVGDTDYEKSVRELFEGRY